MMENNNNDIELLLKADIETLYAVIGNCVNDSLNLSIPDKDELIAIGNKWFISNKERLKYKICENASIKEFALKEDYTKEKLIEIVTVLSGIIDNNNPIIPSVYIAVLITKIGIKKICHA